MQLLSIFLLQATGENNEPNIWVFVAAIALIFLMTRFVITMTKKKPPKISVSSKPSHVSMAEGLGPFHKLNDHTSIAGKMISSNNDVDTYLMMSVVDKSHVRKEVAEESNKKLKAKDRVIRILLWVTFFLAIYILFPYLIEAIRAATGFPK